MTGVGMMMIAGGGMTLEVGSATFVFDSGFGTVTNYGDGFIGAGSLFGQAFPLVGALSPPLALGGTVLALAWRSTIDHATGGQCSIEFNGNRTAGFLSDVKVNGVSLGTVGSPSYSPASSSTIFLLGASGVANPFGTSGSKSIAIS